MTRLKPANVNDSFAPRLALVYAAFFLASGWYLPFFPVWLAARGLDPAAIGIVLATAQVLRVLGTPAGTRLADRYGAPHRAVAVAALLTAGTFALLGKAGGFGTILAAVALYALLSGPLMPLIDAYALRGLGLRGRAYGPVRLWGSVAFVAANLAGGVLLDILAPGNLIWLIFAGHGLVVLAATWLVPLPRDEPPALPGATSHSHLRQPRFLAIAAAGSLIQASHAVYYGFSTLDWTRHGFDGTIIGILWALGVTAEIVLFALAARLPPAVGPITLILIGATGAMVRWVATAFDPPLALLGPLQLLHAASFGATHLGTMQFLSKAAPPGGRATAQGDVATANSVMMASASALSGVLYGLGGSLSYLAMALFAAAGAACALLARKL
ncbi:MAG: transporter, family, 3-phenylpropionic acid transporter [Hyphomicrobiales bacterium]